MALKSSISMFVYKPTIYLVIFALPLTVHPLEIPAKIIMCPCEKFLLQVFLHSVGECETKWRIYAGKASLQAARQKVILTSKMILEQLNCSYHQVTYTKPSLLSCTQRSVPHLVRGIERSALFICSDEKSVVQASHKWKIISREINNFDILNFWKVEGQSLLAVVITKWKFQGHGSGSERLKSLLLFIALKSLCRRLVSVVFISHISRSALSILIVLASSSSELLHVSGKPVASFILSSRHKLKTCFSV